MTDESDKAEQLLQEAKQQKRHQTDPSEQQSESEQKSASLEDAIKQAYDDIEANDLPENLTVRDKKLAGLFAGLKETDKLADLSAEAQEYLGRDTEENLEARATALKLLLRVGLSEVTPETMDAAKGAYKDHMLEQEDEF